MDYFSLYVLDIFSSDYPIEIVFGIMTTFITGIIQTDSGYIGAIASRWTSSCTRRYMISLKFLGRFLRSFQGSISQVHKSSKRFENSIFMPIRNLNSIQTIFKMEKIILHIFKFSLLAWIYFSFTLFGKNGKSHRMVLFCVDSFISRIRAKIPVEESSRRCEFVSRIP